MKTGIIGLPQVGKTSLFKILTKARLDDRGHSRQEHIGVARVPDERLDKLSDAMKDLAKCLSERPCIRRKEND